MAIDTAKCHVRWSDDRGYEAVVLNWGGQFDDHLIPLIDDEVIHFGGSETVPEVYEDYEATITAEAARRIRAELPERGGRYIPASIRAELRRRGARVVRRHTARTGSRYYRLRRADGAEAEVRISDHSPGVNWGDGFNVTDSDWSDVLVWADLE